MPKKRIAFGSRGRRRARTLHVAVAGLYVVILAATSLTSASAATIVKPKPTVSGFAVTPNALDAPGGSVTLSARVTSALSCTFSSNKPVTGLPAKVHCANGVVKKRVTIPANTGKSTLSYELRLSVAGSTTITAKPIVLTVVAATAGLIGGDKITAFAGIDKFGFGGFSGDGGPAVKAELSFPQGVTVDKSGNVYIADTHSQRVRKVSPGGTIKTIAGGGPGLSGDSGPATSAHLEGPIAVAVDGQGNVYISDASFVYRVSPGGILTKFAGTGTPGFSGDGGPATSAQLSDRTALAVDGHGNVYIADNRNNRVREVTTNGIIKTIAGTGVGGFSGDGGPATAARLYPPAGVAVDGHGNIYIADQFNSRVRKVSPNGTITTVAGNGKATLVVVNGRATSTPIYDPFGLAVDAFGNLYISNGSNVYKVSPGGMMTTVAGISPNQLSKGQGDGGPATSATLASAPATGLAFDRQGNLYIADSSDAAIRKIWRDSAATA